MKSFDYAITLTRPHVYATSGHVVRQVFTAQPNVGYARPTPCNEVVHRPRCCVIRSCEKRRATDAILCEIARVKNKTSHPTPYPSQQVGMLDMRFAPISSIRRTPNPAVSKRMTRSGPTASRSRAFTEPENHLRSVLISGGVMTGGRMYRV